MFVKPRFLKSPSGGGSSPAHSAYGAGNIHEPFNWVVADATAKTAVVPVAGDLYKALWQVDTGTIYILTAVSPVAWATISGGGGGVTPAIIDKARISKTTAQNTVGGNVAKVLFNNTTYDTNGLVNIANSRIVVKKAGYYNCNFRASISPASGSQRIFTQLLKNGAEVSRGIDLPLASGSGGGSNGVDTILCAIGDYFELTVFTAIAIGMEAFDFTTFLTVEGPI